MPNRYASPPAGMILVPTPNGLVPMTLADARAYQASHPYAATDPTNPNLSPDRRQQIQDPRVQQLVRTGGSGTVRVDDTDVTVTHGQVTSLETGGHGALAPAVWAAKHPKTTVALMAAPVAAPYAYSALTGGGAAGASTSGAVGTSGSSAAAGGAGAAGTEFVGPTTTGLVNAAGDPIVQGANPSVWSRLGNWLGGNPDITRGVINAAGTLGGAAITSSGRAKAAEIEAQVQREALAYEKQRDQYLQQLEAQRYGELGQRLQPYISAGQNASERMAQILGLPAPTPYTPSVPIPTQPATMTPSPYPTRPGLDTTQPPVGQAVPRPGSVTNPNPSQLLTRSTPATVLMQAPDGTTKSVPAAHVAHYAQRGAQIVG